MKQTPVGDIVSVSGTVLLRSDAAVAKSAEMRVAKQGETLYAQDVINTGSDGRIKVLMKDKSIIDLGPSALFKVENYKGNPGAADREVEVSMVYGTMRAAITQKLQGKGKFKVKTPSATMGVRGTEFVVKSEVHNMNEVGKLLNNSSGTLPPASFASAATDKQGATQITVLQGQVDVGKKDFNASAATTGRVPASAGVVSLTAGKQISTAQTESALSAPKSLDSSQMKAVSTEAKVVDTTFQKAVVIENTPSSNSSGNNSSTSSGPQKSEGSRSIAGSAPAEAIHQVLASAEVPLPPPPAIKPSDINIPGALGPNQIFNQPAINTQNSLKRLRVTIVTQ